MQLNKLLHYLACFIFFSLLFFLFIIKDLANLKPGSAPNGATSRTNYICSFLLLENLVSGTVCVCVSLSFENLSLHALLSQLSRFNIHTKTSFTPIHLSSSFIRETFQTIVPYTVSFNGSLFRNHSDSRFYDSLSREYNFHRFSIHSSRTRSQHENFCVPFVIIAS